MSAYASTQMVIRRVRALIHDEATEDLLRPYVR